MLLLAGVYLVLASLLVAPTRINLPLTCQTVYIAAVIQCDVLNYHGPLLFDIHDSH